MNLFIQGFMGTGKTTIGSELANRAGLVWIDLDHYISEKTGQTISELFQQEGELFFRDLETRCLAELCEGTDQIITTGGGTVIRPENRFKMKESGFRVTLTATEACIWERIKQDQNRPLLATADPYAQICKLLTDRKPFYKEAELIVDTTDKTVEQIVEEISDYLPEAFKR